MRPFKIADGYSEERPLLKASGGEYWWNVIKVLFFPADGTGTFFWECNRFRTVICVFYSLQKTLNCVCDCFLVWKVFYVRRRIKCSVLFIHAWGGKPDWVLVYCAYLGSKNKLIVFWENYSDRIMLMEKQASLSIHKHLVKNEFKAKLDKIKS